jgi:hypothetical protein
MTYRILTVELIDHVRLNKSAQRSTPSKPELQNLNWPPNFVDDDARILKCQDLRVLSRLFNFASWLFIWENPLEVVVQGIRANFRRALLPIYPYRGA